jgi:ribosome-binding factor A
MRIKRTPRLAFVADPAVQSGAAVEEVLRRLKHPPEEADDR